MFGSVVLATDCHISILFIFVLSCLSFHFLEVGLKCLKFY